MSSDSESDDVMMTTPPDIKNAAQEVLQNLLPEKSRQKYDKTYNDFMLWKSSKNAHHFQRTSYYIILAKKRKNISQVPCGPYILC